MHRHLAAGHAGLPQVVLREEPDVRNLIKLKAIYELLEAATDRCQDVANVIESLILENA